MSPIGPIQQTAGPPISLPLLPMVRRFLPSCLCLLLLGTSLPGSTLSSSVNLRGPETAFGLAELSAALTGRGHTLTSEAGDFALTLQWDPARPPQGFSLQLSAPAGFVLTAADSAGATYGLLELAEQIRLYDLSGVTATTQAPAQLDRGIKFNIPLDVRTPTYTEASDSAQHAIAEVWTPGFWHEFIDRLARQRYNLVSLWNLHPFPSLVRVPEYPGVALADVRRSTTAWHENYSLNATDYDDPAIVDHYETLKVMSIDEKMAFWREVMAYAKSRHVKFYLVTWNIFTNGTAGQYGITDDINNPITRDYFAASVRALFEVYPDLAGIGLTTGENMPGSSFEAKEDWAFAAYGRGLLDVARQYPERQFTFIHRQHQTRARDIATTFQPLIDAPNIHFRFSFKYAQAHVMSATRQPFADRFVQDIPPQQTLWTLRNDDNYLFRWGGADFVREFLANIPAAASAGIYYGSDQWVWTREFLSTEPAAPRELELAKHWYHWLLWGRLAYQTDLGNDRLIALLGEHFPGIDATALFAAWNEAAMVYPLTTGFHWGALDFQWYIEACQSQPGAAQTPTGFHDLNRFISLPPHPGTDDLSIPDYVAGVVDQKSRRGTSPIAVATALDRHATAALAALARIDPTGNRELRQTLEDIRAQAYLGQYYAAKILAATDLALLRATLEGHYQTGVARHLNDAAAAWRRYAATTEALYRLQPLWTNRVGYVDLARTYQSVLYDCTIAGVEPTIAPMPPTPGGTILEAEDAAAGLKIGHELPGYTGAGYVDLSGAEGSRVISWTYSAPRAGTYVLEFRHVQRWGGARIPADLTINGTAVPGFSLMHSGTSTNWAWDRATVPLQAGANTITLRPGASPLIDHVNVLDTGY